MFRRHADFHKLMYKRPRAYAVMDFCTKHKVSIDWLLYGDLKGLQRMTQEARTTAAGASTVERIMKEYSLLTPEHRRIVEEEVDRLLEEQRSEAPMPA